MSTEVKVPAVGESISSGIVSVWHKKSGEYVKAGEPLFTLETDKVSTEVVAEKAGTLTTKAAEGQEVKIGEIVATIDESAAAPAEAAPKQPSAPAPSDAKAASDAAQRTGNAETLSPAVRRIVTDEKLETNAIAGTGKGGRLTKGDVLAQTAQKSAQSNPAAPAEAPAADRPKPATAPASGERFTRKKMSPLRRKIATQLVMAQQTAAILTTFNECDMSAVQNLRARAQDSFVKKHGLKLGFMSFFIKATVEALKSVPAVNGRIEGDDFIQNHFFDIGVAVGTEKGLIVPVIRDADRKSFAEIERDIAAYATKAREGKITIDDLQGGVFTISNGGVYGSLLSTPILNPPQSGILGMHSIQQRPVAVKGEVAIRPMMYLALSYDHRAVDGKEAVTFLVRVKDCIEDPTRLLLEF